MRKLVTMLFAITLGVGLAACGGSDDKADTASNANTSDTKAGETTEPKSGGSANAYCGLADKYEGLDGADLAPGTDPASLKKQLELAGEALKDSVALAPSEIKDDVKVFADAYGPFIEALGRANYDFTKLDLTDTATFSKLQEPRFLEAAENIGKYVETHCGAG